MSVNATTQADILQQLQQHRAHWQNCYGVTRIGIFGSVARGEATPNSDIDIVVHMSPTGSSECASKPNWNPCLANRSM